MCMVLPPINGLVQVSCVTFILCYHSVVLPELDSFSLYQNKSYFKESPYNIMFLYSFI